MLKRVGKIESEWTEVDGGKTKPQVKANGGTLFHYTPGKIIHLCSMHFRHSIFCLTKTHFRFWLSCSFIFPSQRLFVSSYFLFIYLSVCLFDCVRSVHLLMSAFTSVCWTNRLEKESVVLSFRSFIQFVKFINLPLPYINYLFSATYIQTYLGSISSWSCAFGFCVLCVILPSGYWCQFWSSKVWKE